MKRLIACVSLVAAATTAAMPATPPAHAPAATAKAATAKGATAKGAHPSTAPKTVARAKCKIAPADEYFGKLKMSILGIRNTIKDQGLKADADPDKASSTFGAIALTEDAIRDWQHKYPCDSWLPGTLYALEHYWGKIHSTDGVKHVHATFAWLRHDFPKSSFVQVARREDGQASATPPAATIAAGTPAPSTAPVVNAAMTPPPLPGSVATPMPGIAPQSVINVQSPSPSPSH